MSIAVLNLYQLVECCFFGWLPQIPQLWGDCSELTAVSPPPPRCVYVGDTDAWCEAFSRSEEQRRDRENWEWGKTADASQLPSDPLQPYDEMLGLRPQPAAPVHWAQSSAQVGVWGRGPGWAGWRCFSPSTSISRSFYQHVEGSPLAWTNLITFPISLHFFMPC